MSVSDTGTDTLAGFRCPASVFFFLFFSFLRHGSDASDTPAVKKKKIPGYFSSFQQFRRIPVCFGGKLVPGRYKMNEFFFPEYFRYLHIFIFGVLDDHDSPNFSLQDHPSLLLPPFNRADSLGGLSFLFLFSFQRATSCFLYILERQSHFILK